MELAGKALSPKHDIMHPGNMDLKHFIGTRAVCSVALTC